MDETHSCLFFTFSRWCLFLMMCWQSNESREVTQKEEKQRLDETRSFFEADFPVLCKSKTRSKLSFFPSRFLENRSSGLSGSARFHFVLCNNETLLQTRSIVITSTASVNGAWQWRWAEGSTWTSAGVFCNNNNRSQDDSAHIFTRHHCLFF